jgi:uracil-DNA glycosylase
MAMREASVENEPLARLLRDVRAFLRFQGELGWRGPDQSSERLLQPSGAPRSSAAAPAPAGQPATDRPTSDRSAHARSAKPQAAKPPTTTPQAAKPQPVKTRPAMPQSSTPVAAGPQTANLQSATLQSASPQTIARPPGTRQPANVGLEDIRRDMGDCRRCKLHASRTQIVFGVGSANARLMLIGEGPGREEDLKGEPFVGAAGQLLDRMIAAMGLARCDVYIANVVKCRPPQNRDPEPDEVDSCRHFLDAQIAAVAPEVIVTLGKHAAHSLLKVATPITRLRGRWSQYCDIAVMPTFHPAYLLRNPSEKKLVWSDLQQVMKRLDLKAPKTLDRGAPGS